jgi:VanZ family protein
LPSLRTSSRIAWALLCAVIVLASVGTWAPNQPGIWAPTLVSIRDVAQNVLIYVAFGAFGVLSISDTDRRNWLTLVVRITGLAILFAACNEALQLYTIDRVASLTDIVSAAIGAFAGGVAASVARLPR